METTLVVKGTCISPFRGLGCRGIFYWVYRNSRNMEWKRKDYSFRVWDLGFWVWSLRYFAILKVCEGFSRIIVM